MSPKAVAPQVVKHGGQDGQQHHVYVVETGGAPSDSALDVAEPPRLEVGHRLGEVVRREREEGQQRRPHNLWAVTYHGSGEDMG